MKQCMTVFLGVLAVMVLSVGLAGAEPEQDHTYLQIAVSENVWVLPAFSNKWTEAYVWLTGETNSTIQWAGWDDAYRAVAATNITVYVYRNSLKNIKADLINTMTPTVRSNLVAKIKQQAQVKASITRTPDSDLAAWGVERKP